MALGSRQDEQAGSGRAFDPREHEVAAARAGQSGALERLGHLLFRFRSFTPVPLLAFALPLLYLRSGPASPLWAFAGLLLCGAGQGLRAWVIGQVPDGTSGQNESLIATELNRTGPYARSRNPLYLGNLGITLGLCVATHQLLLLVLVALLFAAQYRAIIAVEEAFLRERFGEVYTVYCSRVPRFWPRLGAVEATPGRSWSWARALRKEHNPMAAWLLLLLVFLALDQVGPALRAGAPVPWGRLLVHGLLAALVLGAFLAVKGWKHQWLRGGLLRDLSRRLRETRRRVP